MVFILSVSREDASVPSLQLKNISRGLLINTTNRVRHRLALYTKAKHKKNYLVYTKGVKFGPTSTKTGRVVMKIKV